MHSRNGSVVKSAALIMLMCGASAVTWAQQAYPNKPIRFVVGFRPAAPMTSWRVRWARS